MIENYKALLKPEEEELHERLEQAHARLFAQQMQMKEKNLPVLILFEGWGAAGKGTLLGRVIRELDPRFFTAVSMHAPTAEEKRKPFLTRFMEQIPEAGRFLFMDSGWMSEICHDVLMDHMDAKLYKERIGSVRRFERGLTDNGYLVLKFFFHISKKEQRKRLDNLLDSKNTAWQVDDFDLWENKHYDKCYAVYDTWYPGPASAPRFSSYTVSGQ